MNGGGEIVIQLLIGCAFGGVCAAIANSKGRSGLGWFFGGFFLGCIGLIIIMCLSNLNEQNAMWEAQNVQNRRLQEQLKQEQMKNEALRQHTIARLDQHDTALGIDTKQTSPALGMQPAMNTPKLIVPNTPESAAAVWYVTIGGAQHGPFTEDAVRSKFQFGDVNGTTLVWREGMDNWIQLGAVSQFKHLV